MENDFCKKCGKCCNYIKINTVCMKMYRDGIEQIDEQFLSMLEFVKAEDEFTFFKCKYLKNNLCTNTLKPELCKNFPSFPMAFLPEGCGYEGVIFLKFEALKQKIRKLKEEMIHYNALLETTLNKSERQQYQKIINSHDRFVKKYEEYNSEDW